MCVGVVARGQTTGNFNVVLTHYDLILKDKAPLGKVICLRNIKLTTVGSFHVERGSSCIFDPLCST